MTSSAWAQGLHLGLLPKSRKEPWAGLLAEPESEPELKRTLEKGGLRREVVKARRRQEQAPVPVGGNCHPQGCQAARLAELC